ncbi:Sugar ABC transporter ATP-binding protein [Mesomycoplasma dispar]|uniref:Sugar ABC transporter ATP-binding protein n=1 Tax=Mesomycoplasma dispar TaxID=86660 RepID=A0AAJ5TBW7_9BACT|nr:ABC transporter ATP-binding protein [Mesomycoplasma dispar]AJR11969.1 sugar ABC transporter ATP-binding protein [Mesomycoplasma dispar]VEU61252.1 Sugar ABC transporter ATP-binding protein [Mesomycoplasma dispar]
MAKQDYAIEFINVSKKFGNFYANQKIDFKVKKNTIHALIGENGAGKSTLMSTLFGIYTPDEGQIKINGKQSFIDNPNRAADFGIGMVHQHFKLVDVYSNFENIILGQEFSRYGILSRETARQKIKILQEKYNIDFDLDQKTGDASVVIKQKIEIIKILYRDSDILIFDEPTAILSPQEIDSFLEILKFFVKNGKTIIFISHKLSEIKEVANSATVLRHGKVVADFENLENITIAEMTAAMVGKTVVVPKNNSENQFSQLGLKVEGLSAKTDKQIIDLNLEIHKGEILAIAGIEGNGQLELELAISGLIHSTGKIIVYDKENKAVDLTNLGVLSRFGLISYVPSDRHKYAIVLDLPNLDNSIIRNLRNQNFVEKTYIKSRKVQELYSKIVENFDVRGDLIGRRNSRLLSGGNQQKFVLGREILTPHEVLLIVQPTRGLDIGAINLVHQIILEQKQKNKAILLISYELDEVLALADTICVLNKGQLSKKFFRNEIDRYKIGELMGGLKND